MRTSRVGTSRGGRKSKGQRELLATRALVPLAAAARNRADDLGMTMSDYLASLIAQDINPAQFAPHLADQSNA